MLPLVLTAIALAIHVTQRRWSDSFTLPIFALLLALMWDLLFFHSLSHRK